MALDKVRSLSKELIIAQDELRLARAEIKDLKAQLMTKEKEVFEKDRVSLNDMTSYLKALLEQHK